jgi:N-acetylneuraminic acid mutarotase
MPKGRAGLGVSVLGRRLYAVGGGGGGGPLSSKKVWAYDTATNTWTAKASMPTARGGLATRVVNGTLYAVGGCCDSNGNGLSTNEAYSPR